MKKFFLIAMLLISLACISQRDQYAAAKSGLSIRDKPDAKGTVLGKIPYGTKINVTYPDEQVSIATEGMDGIGQRSPTMERRGTSLAHTFFRQLRRRRLLRQ